MQTNVNEVADGVYRLSTWIEPAGLVFNQYLLDAEQPLLFHTGQRNLFPLVRDAVATVMAPERLRVDRLRPRRVRRVRGDEPLAGRRAATPRSSAVTWPTSCR